MQLTDPTVGYFSLAVCIMTKLTIDQALDRIAPDPDVDNQEIRRQEDEDMRKLRPQVSWSELGMMLNISPTAAFKRVKRLGRKRT